VVAEPAIGRADARGGVVALPDAQAAVEGLYERHGARVLAYCRSRLRSVDEAEDAFQTTFLHAFRGLQRGVVPENEIAWLLKIAQNVCLSTWDADRRRRRLELVRDPECLERAADASPAGRENAIALEAALGDLTELQRQAIILREWRGLSYHEIAEELELSQSAVETLIFRGRRALARSLERQDVERPRTLARCLDLGGLLSALKSALGLGGSAKVAVGLIGAAVLAGSIPDASTRPASERPPAATASRVSLPFSPPSVFDPTISPPSQRARNASAEPKRESRQRAKKGKARTGDRPQRQHSGATGPEGTSETSGGLSAVTQPVGETVGGATDAVKETVGGVTETVNDTVDETVPDAVPPVVDTVDDVVDGVVDEVGGVVGGSKNGGGSLLP
jgi:RNA polymerase sigma-70 factor, ECF subfamily